MTDSVHIIGVQFSSFVRAVQFCCEEIGVPYTLGKAWNGEEYNPRSEALKTLHPFGKIPVLMHQGRALFESQSICRYLDNTFNQSRLQAADPWLRAQVDQWCAAITLYVDKAIVRDYLLEFLFPKGEGGRVRQDAVEAAMPAIRETVAILEKQLGGRAYLVGDAFSLADILLMPIAHYLIGAPNNEKLVAQDSVLRGYVSNHLRRSAAKAVFI